MKRFLIILPLVIFSLNFCEAQFKRQLDSLCIECKRSLTDSDKVIALGKLADLYYAYQLNRQGDSVLNDQLQVAELSDNNNLVQAVLFGPSITNISSLASVESFKKTIAFLQKGIDFAKSQNQYDYIALGYTRMANVLRKRGQYDNSLYNATQALQFLPNVVSDSIKAVIYMELGDSYVAKGEAVSAVRNYNNAFDIAVKIKSVPLQCNIYHCLADMYYVFLHNSEFAKDLLKKSLKLDKENNYLEGQIRDYYDLSRVTDQVSYLYKSIDLAERLQFNKYILLGKRLLLTYHYIVEHDAAKALRYMESEPDLKESYINPGIGNYYLTIGHIYYHTGNYDSSLVYYKLAEYDFIEKYDMNRSRSLFQYIAGSYQKLNDLPNAIAYYLRALELSRKTNNGKAIADVSHSLSLLYEQQGDYKQAYEYATQAKSISDSLGSFSKASDIALLDVERENRRHEEELRQEVQKQNSKRDAQYMLITICLLFVFVGMLGIGMFPISKLTIKILGYIFFISLFEFIVLVIDTYLHKLTHGEPLKVWLIKIVLIALLVPLQHYLEHSLIKFLASRKLLEVRTKLNFRNLSVKKWWNNMKKPAPVVSAGIEEDTAVL